MDNEAVGTHPEINIEQLRHDPVFAERLRKAKVAADTEARGAESAFNAWASHSNG